MRVLLLPLRRWLVLTRWVSGKLVVVGVGAVGEYSALKISSSGSFSGPVSVGAKVSWSFTWRTPAMIPLIDLEITDQLASPNNINYTSWPYRLRPGETATVTGFSKLTQAQIDAGKVSNTASASGFYGADMTVVVRSAPFTATVNLPAAVISGRVVNDSAGSVRSMLRWRVFLG